jgi:hypothetical protein
MPALDNLSFEKAAIMRFGEPARARLPFPDVKPGNARKILYHGDNELLFAFYSQSRQNPLLLT